MASFVSQQIPLSSVSRDFSRADLEFFGVDHSGPSFEARVFFNNQEATVTTPRSAEQGYVGSFFIFGHGGCAGDVGHCEIPVERRTYDRRPPHQLTPTRRLVIVTDSLRRLLEQGEESLVVSVVPSTSRPGTKNDSDVLSIDRVSLLLYAWP